jgi:hypothetical protein
MLAQKPKSPLGSSCASGLPFFFFSAAAYAVAHWHLTLKLK